VTTDYVRGSIVSKVMRVVDAPIARKKREAPGTPRCEIFWQDLITANIHEVDLNAIPAAEPRLKREHRPIGRDSVHSDREEWTPT
jgi:hypothetical protein